MEIVAFHADREAGAIYCSNRKKCTDPELMFRFLLENKGDINVFSHLDADVAALLAVAEMSFKNLEKLQDTEKLYVAPYSLKYFPEKMFSATYGGGAGREFINLTDAGQYEEQLRHTEDRHDDAHGFGKAIHAKVVAKEVCTALEELGFEPKSLMSPANVYRRAMFDTGKINLPLMELLEGDEDVIDDALAAARECVKGNWVETFAIGHWDNVWDYDLCCYSEDTECLTIEGWKRITDLATGEHILGFSPDTEVCRFQPVKAMHSAHYEGEMVTLESRKADLLITPNHRVLMQPKIRNKDSTYYRTHGCYGVDSWQVREAQHLSNGNFKLPISFPLEDRPDYPAQDELLQLVAWINTEGWQTYRKKREPQGVGITQSEATSDNEENCAEIKRVLTTLQIPFTHSILHNVYTHLIKGTPMNSVSYKDQVRHQFYIKNEDIQELLLEDDIHLIPLWILQKCSLHQLGVYFNTLIKGDGCRTKSKVGDYVASTAFYTKLKDNADRMSYLCHLLGYKVNVHPPDKSHITYQVFIIEPRKQGKINLNKEDIQYGKAIGRVSYSGIVSCPTIDDGFLVVRRNGRSCICGNSAYPSEAAKLLDLRDGEFVYSEEYMPEAVYGYISAEVMIDAPFSPILYKVEEDRSYTPNGVWETFITKQEYEFIQKWELGYATHLEGFYWIPNRGEDLSRYRRPLQYAVQKLHDAKKDAEGRKRDVLKRMIAGSFYGLFLQEDGNEGLGGKYLMPPYGAEIEANVRLEVADLCLRNGVMPLAVIVDGVVLDKDIQITGGRGLGEWRLNSAGKCLSLGAGRTVVEGKMGEGDLRISYDLLRDRIQEQPSNSEWEVEALSIVTLGKAVSEKRLQDLGKVEKVTRTIGMMDAKRNYKEMPRSGKGLMRKKYHSKPWSVEMLRIGEEMLGLREEALELL